MPDPKKPMPPAELQMRRRTRRSLLLGGIAALAGYGAWQWLTDADPEGMLPWPLRRMLRFNQAVAERLGAPQGLAPTFPPEAIVGTLRPNGAIGLDPQNAAGDGKLRIQHEGRAGEQRLALAEVLQLPRVDLVAELKCVEGWSEVMHFGGVRFRDFVTHFGLATRSGRPPDLAGNSQDLYRYVGLATPDDRYYVALDMASALHPQTLLCDVMNGRPLTWEHGAPLRLYLTVKYGYKSLKRIGQIRFQDEAPPDYWAGRGYDEYAGL